MLVDGNEIVDFGEKVELEMWHPHVPRLGDLCLNVDIVECGVGRRLANISKFLETRIKS